MRNSCNCSLRMLRATDWPGGGTGSARSTAKQTGGKLTSFNECLKVWGERKRAREKESRQAGRQKKRDKPRLSDDRGKRKVNLRKRNYANKQLLQSAAKFIRRNKPLGGAAGFDQVLLEFFGNQKKKQKFRKAMERCL